MNLWTDLTATALLGAGRGFIPVALPGRLNELLGDSAAEERLLRTAGILATAQMAALTVSRAAESAPAPTLPETVLPIAEPKAVALLGRIIEKGQTPLLAEACHLLARAGHGLPPRLLPRALELGRQSAALREPLRQVLGQRGAWLAAQNPDWKFAALASSEPTEQRLWDEGDVRQRASFLRHRRTTDPAEARRLLEAAFASETARDRALLLPSLGENLGPDDEPFLAATLASDRSKEVRLIAAALLSRCPASDFAGRMTARLEHCVHNKRKLLHTVTLIEPPLVFAPEWKADTLEEQPPAQFGERAWWLLQIVSYTPLEWWETKLALDPDGILALAAKSEWKTALLTGFRTAISRQPGHAAWTTALLKRGGFSHQEAIELALTLTPADTDTALQHILTDSDDIRLAAQVIETADFTWSQALWRVAQQKLPGWLAQHDWRFHTMLPRLAYRIPPIALDDTLAWPETTQYAPAIAEFSTILEQRRMLYQSFQSRTTRSATIAK